MSKVLYEKRGKRYYPAATQELNYPYMNGFYLVQVASGHTSAWVVKPKYAEVKAALYAVHDIMIKTIHSKSRLQPDKHEMSKKSKTLYAQLIKSLNEDDGSTVIGGHYCSISEIITAAIDMLQEKIGKPDPNDISYAVRVLEMASA